MDHHLPLLAENREAAEVDRSSIEDYGVSSIALMETAGIKTADWLTEQTEPDDFIAVVCGKGNNAGDGLVCARRLHAAGRKVGIHMIMGDQKLSEDAAANYGVLQTISRNSENLVFTESVKELIDADPVWWVDGIFGTGLNSDVREPVASGIKTINNHPAPTLALDIPSGVDGSKGKILGTAIEAETTIMYGMGKLGGYINEGPDYCGERIIVSLGFTGPALQHVKRRLIESDPKVISPKFNQVFTHKYKAGIVYLLAGSRGMTGAAVMAAKAAWSLGAGGVVILSPAGLMPVFEQLVPEAVKIALGSEDDLWFKPAHLEPALNKIKTRHPHVLLAGPGSGTQMETNDFFSRLLQQYTGKLIIDADACLSLGNAERPAEQELIATPHRGEFRKITEANSSDDYTLLSEVEKFAADQRITVLLKGQPGIVAGPECTYVTGYPTHFYSRFGFGDILAGMVAANFLHKKATDATITAMVAGHLRLEEIISKSPERPVQPHDLIL